MHLFTTKLNGSKGVNSCRNNRTGSDISITVRLLYTLNRGEHGIISFINDKIPAELSAKEMVYTGVYMHSTGQRQGLDVLMPSTLAEYLGMQCTKSFRRITFKISHSCHDENKTECLEGFFEFPKQHGLYPSVLSSGMV